MKMTNNVDAVSDYGYCDRGRYIFPVGNLLN